MRAAKLAFSLAALGALALAAIAGECETPPLEKWTYSIGKESPGAQGNFALLQGKGPAGEMAAYLEGAFGLGGLYVAMDCKLEKPCDAKTFKFMIKTSDLETINIRLRDSTGQIHQRLMPLKPIDGWQEVALKPGDKAKGIHFGGANDGKWHEPLAGVSILLGKSSLHEGLKSGKILVAEIKLLDK